MAYMKIKVKCFMRENDVNIFLNHNEEKNWFVLVRKYIDLKVQIIQIPKVLFTLVYETNEDELWIIVNSML